MQTWPLASPRVEAAQAALATMIDAVGRPRFAASALSGLNGLLRVGSWAVYRLWRDRPPSMHLSASHGFPDTTAQCFAIYRDDGLYLKDCSFDAVRRNSRPGHAAMLRMHASEAPSADHRDAIYMRHGMVERLSVARMEADGSLLAANLYRHGAQDTFGEAEVEHFAAVAPALLATVARHVELTADAPVEGRRNVLRRRCAELTERELDVLERMLKGMTYDGIAADLGLSVATVKTYRLRAFERLDIHFKNELFASFMPRAL